MLKSEEPHRILVKCVCHSILLASSAATAECHFHVNEICNWFPPLSTREAFYREVFRTLNAGEEQLRIPGACDRRCITIQHLQS
jgi:hypothetical protein